VRRSIAIVCIAAVAWLVFGRLSKAHFVAWDDPQFVASNEWLNPPSWDHLSQSWRQPCLELYTPILYTGWSAVAALEHRPPNQALLAGPFHVFNILIHITAAVAAFLLLCEFFSAPAAMAGAMLFLLHPIQVDPVAWVSGAKDLLCGAFSLLALWQYVRFAKSAKQWRLQFAAATVLYAVALLSKPEAMIVPLVAAALDYWMVKRPARAVCKSASIWLILAIPTAIAARAIQVGKLAYPPPIWARPWIAVDTIGYYSLKLIAPINLTIDYERTPHWVLAHPAAAWPGVLVLGLAATAWLSRRGTWTLLPLAIAAIALLPVMGFSDFDFQDFSTPANRYMYLPMFGIAMLLAAWLNRTRRIVPWAAACAALLLLAVLSFSQTDVWQDTESLAQQQLAFDPFSSTGHGIRAKWMVALGRDTEAGKEYAATIDGLRREDEPGPASFWQNYGNFLWQHGQMDQAIEAYQKALSQLQGVARVPALDNLGIAYDLTSRVAEARQQFEEALSLQPDDSVAKLNLKKLNGK
jgi:protein O-mannosyl-transferase